MFPLCPSCFNNPRPEWGPQPGEEDSNPKAGDEEGETKEEQYAPIMGGNNQWVMIGTKDGKEETTCMTHRQF